MNSTLFRTALIAALALPLAGARAQAASATASTPPAKPAEAGVRLPVVSTIVAETREIAETVMVSGTLVPREEVMVATEIEGLAVVEILAEEGDRVAQGQVLARLQRATLDTLLQQNAAQAARAEAQIAQARAQIVEAQANHADSEGQLARARQLRDSGWTSVEKFDQRSTLAQTWEAKVTAARQALAMAEAERANLAAQRAELEVRLGRTEIKAPRAGIISRRAAKLGAVATGVGEPLFRLIADGAVELEAEVADVSLPRIAVGMPVAVQPAGHTAGLDGRVRLISPEVDKATRIGRVRVALPADKGLAVGAFARGIVEIGRRSGVSVPLSAVAFGRTGASVQIIDNGQVRNRPVSLGLIGSGVVEVASGVAVGERVVARAGSFLRDGDRVVAADVATAPGATR